MNVVLAIARQVIVDDERDLLDIESASPDVGRDEDARSSRAELSHDRVALLLGHLAVHR